MLNGVQSTAVFVLRLPRIVMTPQERLAKEREWALEADAKAKQLAAERRPPKPASVKRPAIRDTFLAVCMPLMSGQAFKVLSALAFCSDATLKPVWPGVRTLAERTGMDRRNVQRCLRELETMGVLVPKVCGTRRVAGWDFAPPTGVNTPPLTGVTIPPDDWRHNDARSGVTTGVKSAPDWRHDWRIDIERARARTSEPLLTSEPEVAQRAETRDQDQDLVPIDQLVDHEGGCACLECQLVELLGSDQEQADRLIKEGK